ncbi:MAG: hypothetical protein KIT84_01040 [Labilithrix sp.]|nr:hypothetical protein [Labilithrix sp.]MCW5809570.1 hypothetical protein [Labilithrix sp.]
MRPSTRDLLRKALMARGFSSTLSSPNGTMIFDDAYLDAISISDLLEVLVARREKIFGSVAVVGQDVARQGYDDVVLAIEATKEVIGLSLP